MPGSAESQKNDAARAGAQRVRTGMAVALGTGSTAELAVRKLADSFGGGRGELDAVASSDRTFQLAQSLGIPVRPFRGGDQFDVMLDGADEVAPDLSLTKGGGGALFREKLLARVSREVVILIDPSKLVERLGTRSPIPLEVVPFAVPLVVTRLEADGLRPSVRGADGDEPYRTDNGNAVVDIEWPGGIKDPAHAEADLARIPGVVESGLFVGLAHLVLVGQGDGTVREMRRSAPAPAPTVSH